MLFHHNKVPSNALLVLRTKIYRSSSLLTTYHTHQVWPLVASCCFEDSLGNVYRFTKRLRYKLNTALDVKRICFYARLETLQFAHVYIYIYVGKLSSKEMYIRLRIIVTTY